jgi:hypothetical protein
VQRHVAGRGGGGARDVERLQLWQVVQHIDHVRKAFLLPGSARALELDRLQLRQAVQRLGQCRAALVVGLLAEQTGRGGDVMG